MSNINKQALIAKIKKQAESFDTVVLREDEANALLDELEAAENRIAELEAREVPLPRPVCTYADHSYPAYSERQVVELLESLGIRINQEGE